MRILCVNTNKENCYAVEHEGKVILLDAGCGPKKTIASIRAKLGVKEVVSNIAGALITHKHGDHAQSVKYLVERGVEVFGPADVDDCIIVKDGNTYAGKGFTFRPIEVPHDMGVNCYAYVLTIGGKHILYATDLSYFPPVADLPVFDLILFENNWNAKGLIDSKLHYKVKQRIRGTHMQDVIAHRILVEDKRLDFKRCLFVHRSGNTWRDAFKWESKFEFIKRDTVYEF